VAVIRGSNLPYFGKLSDYRAYSPQEQKRSIIQTFPDLPGISGRETEPEMGLFALTYQILIFHGSSIEDK